MLVWKIVSRLPTRNDAYTVAIKLRREGIPAKVTKSYGRNVVVVPQRNLDRAKRFLANIEEQKKEKT